MVSRADNGKWMYLFRPQLIEDKSAGKVNTKNFTPDRRVPFGAAGQHGEARLRAGTERNVLPDLKWLIFRSNISGANQAYAVELKRADGK